MKKILSVLCIGILSVGILGGCNSNTKSLNEISKLDSELVSTKEELMNSNAQINKLNSELNDANKKIKELEKKIIEGNVAKSDKFDETEQVLNIVTMNSDYERLTEGELITTGLLVEDNIKMILSIISVKYYKNHILELSDIETINGKKIAVINLVGDNYWFGKMQGTTGGSMITYTLRENILQREYKGDWIDGVKFLVDGKQFEEMQHAAELSKSTFR
ncbi:hypothetical protein [Oceanirhabdus seepicola]|uniref:Uncharacterized protein n=1 Tax=Oceanirhabdus seepicola TaxID=2828781 RepID=A0A9J6P9G9_9CLOT|nr:hypothetical protein [Oceanirhabdus seepicola]MCM1992000.1 hypothetical protein [Oceanirhabdus seepicola]